MPIRIDIVRQAANRSRVVKAWTLSEARARGLQTVFLCHSHLDELLAQGVVTLLEEGGWHVYVDWADASMPANPSSETATRIKQRIIDMNYFLFLATSASMSSRWCPWEIGYADGKKQIDKILMLPTVDSIGTHGSEYLALYRRIELSNTNELGVWQPGQSSGGVLLKHF